MYPFSKISNFKIVNYFEIVYYKHFYFKIQNIVYYQVKPVIEMLELTSTNVKIR